MTGKPTPAPWAYERHWRGQEAPPGPFLVRSLVGVKAGIAYEIDNEADAALFVAAPQLVEALLPLIEMAEAQGRFWRAHQKRSIDLEDKTRFAVKAEPWEDRARIGREALAKIEHRLNDQEPPHDRSP